MTKPEIKEHEARIGQATRLLCEYIAPPEIGALNNEGTPWRWQIYQRVELPSFNADGKPCMAAGRHLVAFGPTPDAALAHWYSLQPKRR